MKIGRILTGVLLAAILGVAIYFSVTSLIERINQKEEEATEEAVSENEVPEEEPEEEPTEEAEAATGVTFANTEYNPAQPHFDTMGENLVPKESENYIVETVDDVDQFWDNGQMNYLAFENIIIISTYPNDQDGTCDYFVDVQFRDGSYLQGLRCNIVDELQDGRRFRYGYVVDDSTTKDGQNVMYLHCVQE